jgi:hypothetical protein
MIESLGITFEQFVVYLSGIFLFLIIILFIMNMSNKSKIKKLKAKYNRLMNGLSSTDMEGVIEDCLDKTNSIMAKNREIELQLNNIERNMFYCVQKVGVIRYNAFDNVGSDLSFSVALLDNNDDGLVLSSLYSRDSSSTYAKPVSGGKSKHALSAEEIKAIDTARKKSNASKYTEQYEE